MKRIVALFFVLLVLLTLVSCGADDAAVADTGDGESVNADVADESEMTDSDASDSAASDGDTTVPSGAGTQTASQTPQQSTVQTDTGAASKSGTQSTANSVPQSTAAVPTRPSEYVYTPTGALSGVSKSFSSSRPNPGTLVTSVSASGYDALYGSDSASGDEVCLKGTSCAQYGFNASSSGEYVIVIEYVARSGATRGVAVGVDKSDKYSVTLDATGSDNSARKYLCVTCTLPSGSHTVNLFAPVGFDDTTLKSCDIYSVAVYRK